MEPELCFHKVVEHLPDALLTDKRATFGSHFRPAIRSSQKVAERTVVGRSLLAKLTTRMCVPAMA